MPIAGTSLDGGATARALPLGAIFTYTALVDGIADMLQACLPVLHKDQPGDMVQALGRFGGLMQLNTGFGTVTSRDERSCC
ncbi:hypothetical protein [Arthrobacter sp. Z1-15]